VKKPALPKREKPAGAKKGLPIPITWIAGGVVVIVAVVILVLVLRGNSHIEMIEEVSQLSGGAQTTNYLPVIEEGFDWAGASDSQRARIAKKAVKEALKEVEADQANIYNIMGITKDRQPAFLYVPDGNGGGTIQILVNYEKVQDDVVL